jgi:hypothetical protein
MQKRIVEMGLENQFESLEIKLNPVEEKLVYEELEGETFGVYDEYQWCEQDEEMIKAK